MSNYIDDRKEVQKRLERYAAALWELHAARLLVDKINDERLHPDMIGAYELWNIDDKTGLEIYAEEVSRFAASPEYWPVEDDE